MTLKITEILCNVQAILVSDVHIQQHNYMDKSDTEVLAATRDVTRKDLPNSGAVNSVDQISANEGKSAADGQYNAKG